jgi:glycosyltransferase involved in cell wall biosynthesis
MLEAMACGVPVITSNTSSMPEVAGAAAIIINPYKSEEITAAMINLVDSADLKQSLITAGLKQAAKFSWQAMAEDVLKLYKEVLQDKSLKN